MSLFTSCTKVIDIDLNTSNPQIVVEAKISNSPTERAEVRLSRSTNFNESNAFPAISKAIVTIQDKTANTLDTLKEASAGIYKSAKLTGIVGHTYVLTIQTEGKTLTATSTIPRKVNLDTVEIRAQAFFGNIEYQIIPRFIDLKGIGDNYRFVLFVNGKMKNDIFVVNDELSDGNLNGRPLFRQRSSDSTENTKIGDRIDLEMHSIDKSVYDYFNTLAGESGGPGGGSATPANPITNIKGGALGYFAAYTRQTKGVVVK
jgi:Domain of unknown function (DUF4249)